MRIDGNSGRGCGHSEPVPVPHRTFGAHFPKPKKPRSTSPFPELTPEEAKKVLVPSSEYVAATQPAPGRRRRAEPSSAPPPRIDEAKAHELLTENKLSRKDMAKQLGVSPETLRRFARKHNYDRARHYEAIAGRPKDMPPGLLDDAVSGMSSIDMERKYDIPRRSIITLLRRHGYEYSQKHRTHRKEDPS